TGYSEQRGDQLTIETLPFEITLLLEPPGVSKPQASTPPPAFALPLKLDQKTLMIAGGAVGAVLLLIVVFFIARRKKGPKTVKAEAPAALASGSPDAAASSLAGPNVEKQIE